METSSIDVLPLAMITTGCLTVVLASALAYLLWDRRNRLIKGQIATTRPSSVALREQEVDLQKYPGGAITVYYATQTGTAESFSQSLEREAGQYGFLMHVLDLEDAIANMTTSRQPLSARSIFITATYGEGEAPDGAVPFCKWLQEVAGNIPFLLADTKSSDASKDLDSMSAPVSIFSGVEYAVFGLGNTEYEHFNATGKFMDRALEAAGATRILPLGLGNDNADLEADFEAWKDQHLWPTLVHRYNPDHVKATNGQKGQAPQTLPPCPWNVIYHDDVQGAPDYNISMEKIHSSSRHYFTAYECRVSEVCELQTHAPSEIVKPLCDSTVHVEIDIGSARPLRTTPDTPKTLSYLTADNLGVLPVNDDSIVECVATALGFDLNQMISIAPSENGGEWHGMPFPVPITIRECMMRYLDLTSAPRRSDLKRLAAFCTDTTDQKALLRMSSKEGRQEYKEKILERYVGLVDLLKLCPSLHMPLDHFLHYCSHLQTRFFTISSSSSVHPSTIHLTVAVTKHERMDGSIFRGVCSTHLSKKMGSDPTRYVRVFQRPSTFRLPADSRAPIVMVGPGTGIAPMRAMLQERAYQRDTLHQKVGCNILYFGCKHQAKDYLYRDELETWSRPGGILNHLHLAFSRDQSTKVYVQNFLLQNGAETWQLLRDDNESEGGAYIYVCGGVKMGQDVAEALKEIISVHGSMPMDAARDYLAKLSHDGRFVQELWA
jgi:NADPH-ferrihemoprotein reductase